MPWYRRMPWCVYLRNLVLKRVKSELRYTRLIHTPRSVPGSLPRRHSTKIPHARPHARTHARTHASPPNTGAMQGCKGQGESKGKGGAMVGRCYVGRLAPSLPPSAAPSIPHLYYKKSNHSDSIERVDREWSLTGEYRTLRGLRHIHG